MSEDKTVEMVKEVFCKITEGKSQTDALADLGVVITELLKLFYIAVPMETSWKYNDKLSEVLEKFTCSEIKRVMSLMEKRRDALMLLKTEGYENKARKHNYKKDLQDGYAGTVKITEVFKDSLTEAVGKEANIIGKYSMNPETGKIEEDIICGAIVLELDGKIILENEVNFISVG